MYIASPDFNPGHRLRAQRIIDRALGFTPAPETKPLDLEVPDICTVLLAIEKAFNIALDADEGMDCPTFDALLDLVERKIATRWLSSAAEPVADVPPCALYDFAAYRDALGDPKIGDRLTREPVAPQPPIKWTVDKAPPEPMRRASGLGDIAAGVLIALALLLAASGRLDSDHPFDLQPVTPAR